MQATNILFTLVLAGYFLGAAWYLLGIVAGKPTLRRLGSLTTVAGFVLHSADLALLLGQAFRKKTPPARPAAAAPAPAPSAGPVAGQSPAGGGDDNAASRRAEAMVSAGPGVTRVISPAKATIVPPPPPPPATPAVAPPTEQAAREDKAAAAKKKATPAAPAAKPAKGAAAAAQAVVPEPQGTARAKVSARRGIRLKLIKPSEDDSGLK